MLDTSGIMVTENDDGTIELFYVDFGVEEFGGHDFECTYNLDFENSEKLRNALKKQYTGTLKEMIVSAFTEVFSARKFREFCRENEIQYDVSFWS